jgi:hypothetical protein
MADNSYAVEVKWASKAGWFTPAEARNYYGKYSRDGVTYHWWNSPNAIGGDAAAHDSIVNYLNGRAAAGQAPTVNYVLSEPKLTLCIDPVNVAWTSSAGNPTTIGVECSPHFTDGFYKKAGWLHDQLEKRFGKRLAIYVHFEWTPGTQCSPMDKVRIRAEADKWKAGAYDAPVPVPPSAPIGTPATPSFINLQVADIPNKKVRLIRDANLWNLSFTTWASAQATKTLPAGTIIEVSATAKHPLGGLYYLSEYSYSRGIGNGLNVKDCEDYVDVVAPPKDTSVVQPPADAPINEAPVITEKPTPVPIPVDSNLPTDGEDAVSWLTRILAWIKVVLSKFTFKK